MTPDESAWTGGAPWRRFAEELRRLGHSVVAAAADAVAERREAGAFEPQIGRPQSLDAAGAAGEYVALITARRERDEARAELLSMTESRDAIRAGRDEQRARAEAAESINRTIRDERNGLQRELADSREHQTAAEALLMESLRALRLVDYREDATGDRDTIHRLGAQMVATSRAVLAKARAAGYGP